MTTTNTNLYQKKWVYQIKGKYLYLFEIDCDDDTILPSQDITDGLKLQYETGDKVFIDTSGDDVSSPDEDSLLNVPDSFKKAVIAFVRARMHEDKGELDHVNYWMKQYRIEFSRANEAQLPGPRVAITRSPYAIR